MGVSADAIKQVFNKSADSFSSIYLFSLGKAHLGNLGGCVIFPLFKLHHVFGK